MANKSLNKKLHKANQIKNDEFYTQLIDIENELRYYKEQFRGKVVFLNCDDPYESNFFKYFASNFNHLGLKKLIATSYAGSPIVGTQLPLPLVAGLGSNGKQPLKIEINEVPDADGNGAIDLTDVQDLLKQNKNTATPIMGNGDFRSAECIKLLEESDIVCTNPPFSLFRQYVAQLMEYNKKFLIIGNKNAITYKEIFKLIKENKLWTGYRGFAGGMWFYTMGASENYDKIVNERKLKNVPSVWFTNLDTIKRHEPLQLYKTYTPAEYSKYDNYDAIEVSKTADIPMRYDEVMGVPITFIDKYNPDQFEIVGITDRQDSFGFRKKKYTAGDTPRYNDLNARATLMIDGELKAVYARILIKKK